MEVISYEVLVNTHYLNIPVIRRAVSCSYVVHVTYQDVRRHRVTLLQTRAVYWVTIQFRVFVKRLSGGDEF